MIDRPHPADPHAKGASELAQKPLAVIRTYRKTGYAIVIVERAGRTPHRHRVSLRRYALLRAWTISRAARLWRTSGSSDRSSFALSLWSAL